jgi:hypothetical protein
MAFLIGYDCGRLKSVLADGQLMTEADMFSHCGRLSTLVPVNSTSLNEQVQTIPELNCIFFAAVSLLGHSSHFPFL